MDRKSVDIKSMDRRSVFISYALSDKAFARGIIEQLREKGIDVFVDDAASVGSGEAWARKVGQAIKNCIAVVAILPITGTPGANNTFFEIGLARAYNKKVLAVSPDRGTSPDGERQLPYESLDLLLLDGEKQPPGFIVDTLAQALEAA